jgi:hypothetical protein
MSWIYPAINKMLDLSIVMNSYVTVYQRVLAEATGCCFVFLVEGVS